MGALTCSSVNISAIFTLHPYFSHNFPVFSTIQMRPVYENKKLVTRKTSGNIIYESGFSLIFLVKEKEKNIFSRESIKNQ